MQFKDIVKIRERERERERERRERGERERERREREGRTICNGLAGTNRNEQELAKTNRNDARIGFDFRLFLCPVQAITDRYGVYGASESFNKLQQVHYQEIDRTDDGIL